MGDRHHRSQRAPRLAGRGPASDRQSWRAKPSLPSKFDSVLSKIRVLAEGGLTSLHVLVDFLKRRIAPLKQRPRPAWSFTGPNDCSKTHRGEGSDLPTPYIPGLTGGKWEEWRKEWVIATTEANERLALPTEGPASDR